MGKREYIIFLGLIFELATMVIAFVYAGHYADQKYNLKGFGVVVGALLALVIWVLHLIQAFKQPPEKPPQ
jgi:hypothetical protein